MTIKSSSVSVLKIESSALGLRASSLEELQTWMLSYYFKPNDRELLYKILQSRYFDYSPVLFSLCAVVDNQKLNEIVSDLKFYNLPDILIADCICISAGSDAWKDQTNLVVNPLISKHFNPKHWSTTQIRNFMTQAVQLKNPNIR